MQYISDFLDGPKDNNTKNTTSACNWNIPSQFKREQTERLNELEDENGTLREKLTEIQHNWINADKKEFEQLQRAILFLKSQLKSAYSEAVKEEENLILKEAPANVLTEKLMPKNWMIGGIPRQMRMCGWKPNGDGYWSS